MALFLALAATILAVSNPSDSQQSLTPNSKYKQIKDFIQNIRSKAWKEIEAVQTLSEEELRRLKELFETPLDKLTKIEIPEFLKGITGILPTTHLDQLINKAHKLYPTAKNYILPPNSTVNNMNDTPNSTVNNTNVIKQRKLTSLIDIIDNFKQKESKHYDHAAKALNLLDGENAYEQKMKEVITVMLRGQHTTDTSDADYEKELITLIVDTCSKIGINVTTFNNCKDLKCLSLALKILDAPANINFQFEFTFITILSNVLLYMLEPSTDPKQPEAKKSGKKPAPEGPPPGYLSRPSTDQKQSKAKNSGKKPAGLPPGHLSGQKPRPAGPPPGHLSGQKPRPAGLPPGHLSGLPTPWTKQVSPSGQEYYWNPQTQVTQWEYPNTISQQGETKTATNISPAKSLNDLFSDLKTKVDSMLEKEERAVDKLDAHIPFVKIPLLENDLCVYLGNDSLREELPKSNDPASEVKRDKIWQNIGGSLQKEQKDLIRSFSRKETIFNGSDWPTLKNIGLMISCHFQNKKNYTNITINHIDGLRHVWTPVSENDEINHPNVYKALLGNNDTNLTYDAGVTPFHELFNLIDDTLIDGKNVFIHCNQGEHRSASIIVLYIQFRTQSTFKNAWKYVQQYRTIIKPTHEIDNRQTLMTTFSRLYDEDNP